MICSFFYLLLVLNLKITKFKYDFFPKVSLMAYAWQSGNVIDRKIKNFLEQNYPKNRIEVIIYDNNSNDETKDICLKYERQGLIKYYRTKKTYDRKAPVLDQAIKKVANGEIIALTDPDGVCEINWVKKIAQPFKDPDIGAVAGIIHSGNYYRNLFTKLRAIEDEWWFNISTLGKIGKIRISNFQTLCGANYALRKSAWKSVGESHGAGLVEDYEMSIKLYNKGWQIATVDASVWQEEVENISQYIRQRRRWYYSSSQKVLEGKNKLDKILGGLPISIQATAFLSLIYFITVSAYHTLINAFTIHSLIFGFPFFLMNFTLALGLLKVGKRRLLPYVPLSLTFDGVLLLFVFVDTKINFREPKWLKLTKGKYYHVGSEIRID
jgi:cellulose synthase/poly-beta-1,6-N-acetylglucosamine synthase-like glycosyltransferase